MSITGYPTLSVGQSYVLFLAFRVCTNELADLFNASVTTGGPQGLFSVQGGNVYSLDNTYPQADSWLPVKADGIPLAQFEAMVQAAPVPTTSQSITTSTSTTGFSTITAGCSGF